MDLIIMIDRSSLVVHVIEVEKRNSDHEIEKGIAVNFFISQSIEFS